MSIRNTITAGAAALVLAASTTLAMAQATGTKNNATEMPESKMEMKDGKAMEKDKMKENEKTSAGTSENQAKDLRGHSETPTTGKSQ